MLGRTRDPETGYIGRYHTGQDLGIDARCRRCGGRGMWRAGGRFDHYDTTLCLRCVDDWHESDLLEKHGYSWSRKKWIAAFEEFLQTKPSEVDIATHNRKIESTDELFFKMNPHLKKLVEDPY